MNSIFDSASTSRCDEIILMLHRWQCDNRIHGFPSVICHVHVYDIIKTCPNVLGKSDLGTEWRGWEIIILDPMVHAGQQAVHHGMPEPLGTHLSTPQHLQSGLVAVAVLHIDMLLEPLDTIQALVDTRLLFAPMVEIDHQRLDLQCIVHLCHLSKSKHKENKEMVQIQVPILPTQFNFLITTATPSWTGGSAWRRTVQTSKNR